MKLICSAFIGAQPLCRPYQNWIPRSRHYCLCSQWTMNTSPPVSVTGNKRASFHDVNETILSAVERANGGRVTASDVAVLSGHSVPVTSAELSRLAWLIGGAIDVTQAGDLSYRFVSPRVQLRVASLRTKMRMAFERAVCMLHTCMRFGFGDAFLISATVTFIWLELLFEISCLLAVGLIVIPILTQIPVACGMFRDARNWTEDMYGELTFSEAVHSVVFGDGNPNEKAEQNQWRAITAVIDVNDGAVTAEQLRPFTLDARQAGTDERDILPILVRFDGRPAVTERGDIIYIFDQFESTAKDLPAEADEFKGAYLQEIPLQFTQATKGQFLLVGLLGAYNIGGVMMISSLLSEIPVGLDAISKALFGLTRTLYPVLVLYAFMFAFLPLIRFLWIWWRNGGIRRRNAIRSSYAAALSEPQTALANKLKASREYGVMKRVIRSKDVVYSNDMEISEVARNHDEEKIGDFDQRMAKRR